MRTVTTQIKLDVELTLNNSTFPTPDYTSETHCEYILWGTPCSDVIQSNGFETYFLAIDSNLNDFVQTLQNSTHQKENVILAIKCARLFLYTTASFDNHSYLEITDNDQSQTIKLNSARHSTKISLTIDS